MQGECSLTNEQSFARHNFVMQQVKQMWVGALDSAHYALSNEQMLKKLINIHSTITPPLKIIDT